MIPEDEDTRIALNVLARHQTIYNLYRDILIDMMVCEIEGWDKKEYLNQLKSVIEHFERKGREWNTPSRQRVLVEQQMSIFGDNKPKYSTENKKRYAKILEESEE